MLPPGFQWGHAIQWQKGPEDCLRLEGTEVVRMSQRVDDLAWSAMLDQHLDWGCRRRVSCTSYEQGRAGVGLWVKRHEERLRREVEEQRARRQRR